MVKGAVKSVQMDTSKLSQSYDKLCEIMKTTQGRKVFMEMVYQDGDLHIRVCPKCQRLCYIEVLGEERQAEKCFPYCFVKEKDVVPTDDDEPPPGFQKSIVSQRRSTRLGASTSSTAAPAASATPAALVALATPVALAGTSKKQIKEAVLALAAADSKMQLPSFGGSVKSIERRATESQHSRGGPNYMVLKRKDGGILEYSI
ncbi:hypothetical protein IFM89_021540 [Coptis chinensis]|uniref:Uncharacterized protein n=1 Tax=Coptis chinensis TaxID=261450 RepID=A0A835IBW8_9MAGN|nr:hypothetical protein IFM89_021540 [Coptis chinensis]